MELYIHAAWKSGMPTLCDWEKRYGILNMLQEIDCFERSAHVSLSLQAAQQLDAKPVVPLYTQCALARGP